MNILAEKNSVIEQSIWDSIRVGLNHHLMSKPFENNKLAYAKQLLDQYFPLTCGSHQNVCSYVVYYNQLLAFLADGQQSGLRQARQFVAFSGHKSEPSTILLENNGFHLEISLAGSACDLAGIEDVQVEAKLMTILNQENMPLSRTWTSLITGLLHHPMKQFTAKDGSIYEL